MHHDDRAEAAPGPAEVHLTRIDVPFVELTAFFVKASFALGLAFLLTSWLWVIVGTGVAGLSAGLLVLAGVPGWFESEAPAPAAVAVAAPAPAPAPPPEPTPIVVLSQPIFEAEPPAPPPAAQPVAAATPPDANRAATEAAQLAELERMRRERAQRGDRP
jgi:hypothetical protein